MVKMFEKKMSNRKALLWIFLIIVSTLFFIGCSSNKKNIDERTSSSVNNASQSKKQDNETKENTFEEIIDSTFQQKNYSSSDEPKKRKELAELMLKEKESGRPDWKCYYALYIPRNFIGKRSDCEVIVFDIFLTSSSEAVFKIFYPKEAFLTGEEYKEKIIMIDDPGLKPYYPFIGTPYHELLTRWELFTLPEDKTNSFGILIKFNRAINHKKLKVAYDILSDEYKKRVGGYSQFVRQYNSLVECHTYWIDEKENKNDAHFYYDLFTSNLVGSKIKTQYYHVNATMIKVGDRWKLDSLKKEPCSEKDTKFTKEFIENKRMSE